MNGQGHSSNIPVVFWGIFMILDLVKLTTEIDTNSKASLLPKTTGAMTERHAEGVPLVLSVVSRWRMLPV